MATILLTFLGAAVVIVIAGVFLTKYGDAIAELTGFGRLLVGSILLAGATSLPELSVDINAIRLGQPNLAVGDLLGSCLFNLLILAVLDLANRSRGRMFSPLSAAHALSAMMTVVLTSVAVLAMLAKPMQVVGIPGGVGMGVGTLAILLVYVGGCRLVYLDQRMAASPETPGPDQAVLIPPQPHMTLTRAILGFVAAAAVIFVAAPYMAHAADELAEISGLGRSFIGTTLVALSTSLPELVASIAALRMRAYDLALGNVFGSNSFNIAMLAILDLFQDGPLLSLVAPVNAITGMAVILVTSVAVIGQLYKVESRRAVIEPDAILVIGLVLGSLWLVYIYS